MSLGLVSGLGYTVVVLGSIFCVLRLFLVSCRFLYTLIALEQINAVILVGSLILFLPQENTYFVALLVMFTVEAVIGLVVLTRV